MRRKNYKGRCEKRMIEKCTDVCRTYDAIQYAYAEILSACPDIVEFRCNVPLDGLEEGEYTTDFVCTKQDGDLMVRECVFRRLLTKPMTIRLSDKSMKCYFGGVRKSRFNPKGSVYMLIKHPLMFIDEKLEPVTDPHYCNKAYIADVNGVLKHYKFTSEFKDKLNSMVDDYSYYGRNEHEEYLRVLKKEGDLVLYSPSAQKFSSVNQLVEVGFLKVSKKYLKYVQRYRQ